MNPKKVTIKLFYDIVSPYAYIAFETLSRYRAKWFMDIEFWPVLLGGVWKATGNQSIMRLEAKAKYTSLDLQRLAKHYQMDGFNSPIENSHAKEEITEKPIQDATFPGPYFQQKIKGQGINNIFKHGSLPTMRFITSVRLRHPDATEHISRELYKSMFVRQEDVTSPEVLVAAGRAIGLTQEESLACHASMNDPEVKEELRKVTQMAVDYGAFGVPSIMVPDSEGQLQLVFGSDRMPIIAEILGKKYDGPLPAKPKSNL